MTSPGWNVRKEPFFDPIFLPATVFAYRLYRRRAARRAGTRQPTPHERTRAPVASFKYPLSAVRAFGRGRVDDSPPGENIPESQVRVEIKLGWSLGGSHYSLATRLALCERSGKTIHGPIDRMAPFGPFCLNAFL